MGIVIDYERYREKLVDEYLFKEPNVIRKSKITKQANKLAEWIENKKRPSPL